MRIAFSGAHLTGKSSLLARVAERLPGHASIDEPYHLLEDEGHDFADPPTIDDFEAQLARLIAALEESDADVLFDRCPLDVVAYLRTHDDAGMFDPEPWLEPIDDAMRTLDLIVFVPIETPDRIAVPSHEDRRWRAAVHEQLEALLDDVDVEVLRVDGDLDARVRQVLARVR